MKPRIDTFPLFIVCAEYTRCIGIFSNIVSSLYYNDVSFLHGYRAGIIVLCIFEVKNYFNRRHLYPCKYATFRYIELNNSDPVPVHSGIFTGTVGVLCCGR